MARVPRSDFFKSCRINLFGFAIEESQYLSYTYAMSLPLNLSVLLETLSSETLLKLKKKWRCKKKMALFYLNSLQNGCCRPCCFDSVYPVFNSEHIVLNLIPSLSGREIFIVGQESMATHQNRVVYACELFQSVSLVHEVVHISLIFVLSTTPITEDIQSLCPKAVRFYPLQQGLLCTCNLHTLGSPKNFDVNKGTCTPLFYVPLLTWDIIHKFPGALTLAVNAVQCWRVVQRIRKIA